MFNILKGYVWSDDALMKSIYLNIQTIYSITTTVDYNHVPEHNDIHMLLTLFSMAQAQILGVSMFNIVKGFCPAIIITSKTNLAIPESKRKVQNINRN